MYVCLYVGYIMSYYVHRKDQLWCGRSTLYCRRTVLVIWACVLLAACMRYHAELPPNSRAIFLFFSSSGSGCVDGADDLVPVVRFMTSTILSPVVVTPSERGAPEKEKKFERRVRELDAVFRIRDLLACLSKL